MEIYNIAQRSCNSFVKSCDVTGSLMVFEVILNDGAFRVVIT